jgi:hypothetical protein
MILFNAALVGAYWERLLVLPLEQRRVAGREPLLERRSEEQPEYLGESLLHLHPHRAPITATQPTDIPLTDIRATRSRAMDIRATRDTPLIPCLPVMDTQATREIPLIPVPQATDTQATRDTLPTPVPPMDTRAARHTLPIRVPVTDIPCMAIPAIALRRTGRLGPSTLSNLLGEFRPKIRPQSPTLLVRDADDHDEEGALIDPQDATRTLLMGHKAGTTPKASIKRIGDLAMALAIAPSGALVAVGATSQLGTASAGPNRDACMAAPQPMTMCSTKTITRISTRRITICSPRWAETQAGDSSIIGGRGRTSAHATRVC